MPIGVPRIIYCWGEELPAQWTDIYNFIFRRRMVFLMQYLDDELCNQICGLLINIHMEDRSKELEKKEMERSGVFKSSTNAPGNGGKSTNATSTRSDETKGIETNSSLSLQKGSLRTTTGGVINKKSRSMEDLLNADEDLGIDDIDTLEQYTLQKITTEWLNWNAQFFDYSDEPYLFYLAELLSKDFTKGGQSQNNVKTYSSTAADQKDISQLLKMLATKGGGNPEFRPSPLVPAEASEEVASFPPGKEKVKLMSRPLLWKEGVKAFAPKTKASTSFSSGRINKANMQMGEVYSPFRTNTNFSLFPPTAKEAFNDFWPEEAEGMLFWRSSKVPEGKQPKAFAQTSADSGLQTTGREAKEKNKHPKGALAEGKKHKLLEMFLNYQNSGRPSLNHASSSRPSQNEATYLTPSKRETEKGEGGSIKVPTGINKTIYNLLSNLAQKDLDLSSSLIQEKILGQKNLRRSFALENQFYPTKAGEGSSKPEGPNTTNWDQMNSFNTKSDPYNLRSLPSSSNPSLGSLQRGILQGSRKMKSFNYLNPENTEGGSSSISEFRDYYRKQTERALIEEESKKVFVIINSFGGSVGNGVTVHDALQFIKAGSLTLALGVAASAASLVLAGGTIGERYVTEGCHVMAHQPEGGLQGQASDIWIDSQEIMKIRLDVAEIYSLSTYRPRHKILRDLDRDFYLTATETIQYGLADEIATNDTMKEIINMTSQVWDYHDSKQQRLLESRESASSGLDTQTQN